MITDQYELDLRAVKQSTQNRPARPDAPWMCLHGVIEECAANAANTESEKVGEVSEVSDGGL